MLFHLLTSFRQEITILNVVRYITFRTAVASLTALFLVLVLGPWMIERLRRFQIGQYIREEGPQSHKAKAGTPTMGGVLILVGILVPTLLWSDLTNRNVWIAVLATLAFGAIGFWDDYTKVARKRNLGLTARRKLLLQLAVGLLLGAALYWLAQAEPGQYSTRLIFPFFKAVRPELALLYVFFAALVVVFASNAVNLTDGLDGLAILPTVMVASALAVFAYVAGHAVFSKYLGLPHIPGAGELVVFCAAIAGAGLAFLWFNAYPAEVFMGDVGALALGAALGVVAVIVRQEIVLFIMGGVFVMETLSVMIQVASYKLTGKRVFRMAPLHHHYELKGWKETQVVVRFWIITMMLVLIGLSTLKLR